MAIKQLLQRNWEVSLRHTLRDDALSDSSLVILNEAPF